MCINDLYLEDLAALNELFDNLNKTFFESALSKPVITIQHDNKGVALGWFTRYESWQSGKEKSPEINISANFLDRLPIEKAATMLHEMCHLYAYQNKIQDCSRSGNYHNSKFKTIAEEHGLEVIKTQKGFNQTKLTSESIAKVESYLNNLKSLKRLDGMKGTTKKSSTRKYVCPTCCLSVRATKEVNISCNDCDCVMIEE